MKFGGGCPNNFCIKDAIYAPRVFNVISMDQCFIEVGEEV